MVIKAQIIAMNKISISLIFLFRNNFFASPAVISNIKSITRPIGHQPSTYPAAVVK